MLTKTQLEVADTLDEMEVGQTVEFFTGDFVKRKSPERYAFNDDLQRRCAMEVVLRFGSAQSFLPKDQN